MADGYVIGMPEFDIPANPKIYHIVNVDRLQSIIEAGNLYSDAAIRARGGGGTTIGMNSIKERRLQLPVP